MNIFVLDENPLVAATDMCDKHVPKMIVESAQMLCTAHRVLDGTSYIDYAKNGRKIQRWSHSTDSQGGSTNLYKAAMVNHPCTKWVRESSDNYLWLSLHSIQLLKEFTTRFGGSHGSRSLVEMGIPGWWGGDRYGRSLLRQPDAPTSAVLHLQQLALRRIQLLRASQQLPLLYGWVQLS